MALTKTPIELSSTPSIVDGGNATAITISSAELVTVANGLTLTDGNVVVANGHGIDFSATSGSGTSELLDDYEEGTWTPTDASGASLSLAVNAASYTKIGRSCYISAYITYPTNSSSAAQLLGGLPFTTRSPNTYAQLSVRVVAAAFTTNNITFQTQTNSNYGKIHFATTFPDNSDLSGLSFLISGVYETA